MYCDLVLIERTPAVEELGKKLGFGKIVCLDDVKRIHIVDGTNEMINRKAVEDKKTQILLNPHQVQGKDRLQQRTSGLNQVLCSLAHENNVAIGMSLDSVQESEAMGRVMQNIMLCRKYNVRMLFFTRARSLYEMRSASDLMSFCKVVGMTPGEAKVALTGLSQFEKG